MRDSKHILASGEPGAAIGGYMTQGFDESDEVTGSGSAELNDDGALEIELSLGNGDYAVLIARRG